MAEEKMEQEAAEVLKLLKETIESGAQFVTEQAPPLAQEIVRWGIVYNGVMLGCLLPMAGMLAYYWARVARRDTAYLREEEKNTRSFDILPPGGLPKVIRLVGFSIAWIPVTLMAARHLYWLMMAWFAPRLYIVKTISGWLG